MFLTIIQCFHSIQWFNQLLFNCNNYQPLSLLKMRETSKRSVLLLRLPNKKCLSSVTSLPPPSRIQCFHSQFLTISSTVASFSSVHVSNWSLWPKQTFLLANIGPIGPLGEGHLRDHPDCVNLNNNPYNGRPRHWCRKI